MTEHKRPKDYGWIHPTGKLPRTVALIGLGPSQQDYISLCLSGLDLPPYDEVWTVNAGCRLFQYDVLFHMDDLRLCRTTSPNSVKYVRKALNDEKPVITSVAYPEFAGIHQMIDEFGQECRVINRIGNYFTRWNGTSSWHWCLP